MPKDFISFQVKNGLKHGTWYIDISNLSTIELIKLKEEIKKVKGNDFSSTISALDNLIYSNIDEFNASGDVYGNRYRKNKKRNMKIKKRAKMKKYRRR